ncbi:MAG: hypothetical protein ACP5N7_00175 [Candidatus Pacearchaeota archaeon]
MKIKIEYLYDGSLPAPFVAVAINNNGERTFHCSVESFEKAKEKLIKENTPPSDIIIPDPEEVEI